ncbi:unnamed protein product [Linum tenue]|uniref:Anaphase-promoting complex subunit 7 n=1 Tax=Linum tenue TaxID=586396 RepID=A0AAV0P8N7_9ROSI|nr:unnamed protein product [Linum tenue]
MDISKDQIATLLDHDLHASAQMLHTYKQALQYCKIIPKQNSTSARTSLSSRSSSPSSFNASAINENEVKFKIASCHSSLNETRLALAEMEGIPSKARTLQMSLLMAKLFRNSRHNRYAIACYRECLRNCPYVMEAIIALAELGVAAKDIISLFSQVCSFENHTISLSPHPPENLFEFGAYPTTAIFITSYKSGRTPFEHIDSNRWLQRYVEAQCCVASNDYKGGLELFAELLQRFPSNIHILLETAKVEAIIGKSDEAIVNFEKVRSLDPFLITYMDEYAILLKGKSDYTKLNKLVHDLLSIDPTRPEVFVALSVLWERKDERGALSYAEKGNILLSLKRPEVAVIAFRGAHDLRADLRSYQGLVHSYLAFSKTKEALHAAREAMKAMPQSAKALKLVGDVHASNSSGREKAKKFYESALRLEPGYFGAALALAELHCVEGRNGDAVSLLERYVKDWADDSLHVKLAQVYAATNALQEALSHYQAALRLNPQNEAAKKGLERLEKQMKGVDPDAPEEDEENEVEDADEEPDEIELLRE